MKYLTLFTPLLLVILSVSVRAITCGVRTVCGADELELFSVYDSTNAHAAEAGWYAYKVCCSDVISAAVRETCQANEVEILSLYNRTDSHVARAGWYPYKVCVDWLNCTLRQGSCATACLAYEECTASLYAPTDSHIAVENWYDWSLCCGECDVAPTYCQLCCEEGASPGCGIPSAECTSDTCWNLGGEPPGASTCCGDDDFEWRVVCQSMWGVLTCVGGVGDVACCRYPDSCVYDDTCYGDGWIGDADGDGENEMCDAGMWIRPLPVWRILWRDLLRIISRILAG